MANHRGRNEGSISKRGKKWRAQFTQKGKRYSATLDTKTAAQAWIQEKKGLTEKGVDLRHSRQTIGEYLPVWLENHRMSIRPKTAHQYEGIINLHILPALAHFKLQDLRLKDVESFYSSLLENNIGIRTIRLVHSVLHKALLKAVQYGLIVTNPSQGAILPRYDHKEMLFLTPQQIRVFLQHAKNHEYYSLYHFAIWSGLRSGELRALKWSDIERGERPVLHVNRQVLEINGQGMVTCETKTKASRRSFELSGEILKLLDEHLKVQMIAKAVAGDQWQENDLIFCNSVGKFIDASRVRKKFDEILSNAGLPRIRIHDLRHTCASLLISKKVPLLVVSKRLGHADPYITMKHYEHLIREDVTEANGILDDHLAAEAIDEVLDQT